MTDRRRRGKESAARAGHGLEMAAADEELGVERFRLKACDLEGEHSVDSEEAYLSQSACDSD